MNKNAKWYSEHKGISPLLASVLIIAVTVSIATLVMGWISTTVRASQNTIENRTVQAVGCSSAGIVIDNVFLTASAGTGMVKVTIRNSGASDLTIISAQVYNSTGHNFTANAALLSGVLTKGSITTMNFTNVNMSSCPSTFSKAVVTSNCGGISAIYDKAPRCG